MILTLLNHWAVLAGVGLIVWGATTNNSGAAMAGAVLAVLDLVNGLERRVEKLERARRADG